MFSEFTLFVLMWLAFLSLVITLINGKRRIDYDPVIDEFMRLFASVLLAGFTVLMLEYGKLQFAVLGGVLLAGLLIEYIKERN